MSGLRNLFARMFSSKPTTTPRPQSKRLGLEALEDRMVMSASSLNLHAVGLANGTSAAFLTNPVNHGLYELTSAGTVTALNAPGQVSTFSAGVDNSGHEDVFANISGSLYNYDAKGWHALNQPEAMTSFAAVQGGRAYAVGADGTLYGCLATPVVPSYITINGRKVIDSPLLPQWTKLSGPNTVLGVDAVTEANGTDVVYARCKDGSVQEFITSTNTWVKLAAPNTVNGFSAGLDASGYADVFMVTTGGTLECYHIAGGGSFTNIANVGSLATVAATTDGYAYVVSQSGKLALYANNSTTAIQTINPGTVNDMAVGVGHDLFFHSATGIGFDENNYVTYFNAPQGTHW